jgi:hypothetical protein
VILVCLGALPKTIKAILKAKPAPWEVYPPDNPFGTPDVYSEAVTGRSWEALLALVADLDPSDRRMMLASLAEAQAKTVKPGRPKETETRYNTPNLKRGTSMEATLRRIANDAPEVLERYEAGEFKSVAAAARVARIALYIRATDVALSLGAAALSVAAQAATGSARGPPRTP